MSNVIPVKRNPPKKDCDLKVKPKVAMEALETKVPTKGLNFFISSQSGEDENKVSFKVDTATQTFSPNGLYTTEPNVQNKNVTKVQNKRKSFSRIKSEFSECLYPFDVVEDWVNDCPSECSELSHVSFETCEDIPAYPNLSENDRNILLQLSDPSLREYFLGIRGLHPDYTSKFKIEKRKTSYNEPREYLQKNNAPSSSSDYSQGLYPKISDTEWFQESKSVNINAFSSLGSWQNDSEHFHSNGVNIPHQYCAPSIPDRCFNLNHSDQEEDLLGEAGGGEERGLRQSMHQPRDHL